MNFSEINFEPIDVVKLSNPSFLNEVGEKYGEGIYVLNTIHQIQKWDNKENGEILFDVEKVMFCKVVKVQNGYIGIINGAFHYDYANYNVIGICKLNINK